MLYDQFYDKRFTKVFSKYFKGNLFWDILACFPVLAYEIYRHQNKDECSSEHDQYTTIYKVVYGLKLLKFTSIPKIKQSVLYIESLLKDLFVKDKIFIERMFSFLQVFVLLFLIMHLSACGWIMVGQVEWMTFD